MRIFISFVAGMVVFIGFAIVFKPIMQWLAYGQHIFC